MFFNDISEWESKKLKAYHIAFNILYFLLTLIAPIIVIAIRYKIFVSASYRVTGWGLIFIITFLVVGVRALNKGLEKLPDITLKEQKVKYTILGIKALIIPVFIVIILGLLKSNFSLAYTTAWICLIFYVGGIFVDYLFIKYLEREIDFRRKAKEKIEIDKRVENLRN